MIEVERKFLLKKIPDLKGLAPKYYERHFLFRNSESEIRIQKKGEKYEFERKFNLTDLTSGKHKFEITKEEYEKLKNFSTESIFRESYLISGNPEISIKIYHGRFEGLKRAEIEFKSEKEAADFKPFDWFGEEITASSLGRDSRLLDLSEEEFIKLINKG